MVWKFELINSADMSSIGILKQARGRTVQLVHNRAGAASFSYPIEKETQDDEYAHLIVPYKTGIKALRYNWRATAEATILAGKTVNIWDNVWSGYVLPISRQISSNRMEVNCVGWLNRFERRFLRERKIYPYVESTSTDDADIIFSLIDAMNANPAPDSYMFTPMTDSDTLTLMDSGSKLPNEGSGGATAYTPAYRGALYEKDQQILQAFIDLMEIENGCDITVDPETRIVDIYRKYMRDLPNVEFGYGRWPRNVQALDSPLESEKTVNYFLARGSSLSTPRYQDDTDSMAEFGPLEEIVTLSDVVDTQDDEVGSVLQHYASIEVLLRAFPPYTFQITPFPYTRDSSIPEPLVDYRIGDQPRLNAKKGKVIDEKDLAVRIFGMTFNIDDNSGNEKLQALQVIPQ